jgi:hypothetical protein
MTEAVAAQKLLAEEWAWTAFQMLAGMQVALCPVTVRPCKKSCRFGNYYVAPVGEPGGGSFSPHIVSGQWINSWCGDSFDCSCSSVEEVVLPGPVGAITEVKVDGQVVDPTAYRVDNGNRLVRTDGQGWPYCQDMTAPDSEEGTFSVTYIQGAAADSLVNYAVGVLADEFYRSITGDKKCRLSSRVTAVTRQGVSYEMSPGLFSNGVTGIDEVDVIIMRYNPSKLKQRPQVASPDSLRARPRQRTAS